MGSYGLVRLTQDPIDTGGGQDGKEEYADIQLIINYNYHQV